MSEFKFPTEEVELPSKGLVYPEDNPLSNGKIEIKYMTAKEEDILTNQAYIQKGIVLDKLIAVSTVSQLYSPKLVEVMIAPFSTHSETISPTGPNTSNVRSFL